MLMVGMLLYLQMAEGFRDAVIANFFCIISI